MSDTDQSMQQNPTVKVPESAPDTTPAIIAYILLLCAVFTGVTPVIGVIVAYVYRGKGPFWLDEQYRYIIRTFWIGVVYLIICSILSFIVIGFFLFFVQFIWWIVRCVVGFKALHEKRAPQNVSSWLW